ncbi:MAG: flagellar basal body P-ring protein FlgI [Lentisphaerae bacterium]|nr:flagellar basal body P-ring protein FlgI [Lentisphaerota bacterium]
MKNIALRLFALLLGVSALTARAATELRIKDIARIAETEPMELIGYGLVVGLNGTGDKDLTMTKQTLANVLENFLMSVDIKDIKSKNVAAVMVTAKLNPFHHAGDKADITVSSIGDARSLQGGQLLMTPLLDPEGKVYALAQGSLTVGGYNVGVGGPGGAQIIKNTPTSGTIAGGAMLKYGNSIAFHDTGILRLVLRHPDFTTAERTADVINKTFNGIALAKDAGTILVEIPQNTLDSDQVATFIAGLELLPVKPDTKAKIIINERTGTIVMGNDVKIAPAVVAHENLTVSIKSELTASQPTAPFGGGAPIVMEGVTTRVDNPKAKILALEETATVQELANNLNNLGATTSDLIAILEALSQAGALQVEIVTM